MGKAWPALDIHFPCQVDRALLDDLVAAALDDFEPTAIQDATALPARSLSAAPVAWRVFFASGARRDEAAAALRRDFRDRGVIVAAAAVADEDWAARSQADLPAVRVGTLEIASPWLADRGAPEAAPAPPVITILIQPSMGFGTGHHATTRLCLAALQAIELGGRRVLDVGTGSGVLAIAARRLGAGRVVAVEVDEDALASARENVHLNQLEGLIELRAGDFRVLRDLDADVIVANLSGALLERAAGDLLQRLAPGGRLIASGYVETEEDPVARAFAASATLVRRDREDEWICTTWAVRGLGTGDWG